MNNRRYQTTVTMHRPEGLMLEVDVISQIYPTEQVLYSVPLARLAAKEIRLEDGRFDLYRTGTFANCILTQVSGDHGSIQDIFTDRLNWISDNATDRWSFDLGMEHVSKALLVWSFNDLNDALLFKLTF